MTIRAVVFDIGGVLELTHDGEEPTVGLRALFEQWTQRLDLDPGAIGGAVRTMSVAGLLGHVTEDEFWAQVTDKTGAAPEDVAELREAFWAEYLGILNEELLEFFGGLRDDYKTALLSNSFVGAREREREAYRFEDYTELIVYSHEEGVMKPGDEIYLRTCMRLGVEPHEAIFLDDIGSYLKGARGVGMHTIKFVSTEQAVADIQRTIEEQR